MTAQRAASFSLVAVLLAATPAPTLVRGADDPEDVAALSKKLRQLEEEVAALRQRLAELGQQPSLQLPPAYSQVPAIGGAQVPPDWHQREFNGQRYYVVPLAK